ncbi:SDR family oxidoreductase [uncultured Chitinophaga sp.]|jgi:Short-chain dehydrogenases of various substrate specificities|uniref:SDR family NAD(P)-dependent oxidoreductase n=1 Tax=uncultured Chitinophaga sp. TaxID=339340 RepID=UPI00261F9979|nr:SDR family oxidoreductase [uncultured Chitinophaga sp.]
MNVTLITGASAGIGEAAAHEFAARQHNLLLVARSEQKLTALCTALKNKYRIEAQYIVADLSQPGAPQAIFEACRQKGLEVQLLINNAGIGSSGEFYKNDLSAELSMLQLNISSLVALTHLFLPAMIQRRKGDIINVASLAAYFPSPYMAAYSASKAFVKSFSLSLCEECKPYGVQVMLFSPGLTISNFMNTPANDNAWGKALVERANTQTSEQVAHEMAAAWEKHKTLHISGRKNRLMLKIGSLVPHSFAASSFAKAKRKRVNFSI